jgi:acyl transferase domain-containing protein
MTNPVPSPGSIAIIGMAGRFPKAANIDAFWQNLRNGRECITFFTDQELHDAGIDFPHNNPNYVKARGVLENPGHFDAPFFAINPKEAELIDPQQRVFLECACEALENAACDPSRETRPIGVFAGCSMNTYLAANLATHPGLLDLAGAYALMLANDKDFLPTRVSYKLNLKGPSLCIQTACSTSLVAVCVACQHLLNFQCDIALAGGVSITFPQKIGRLYQEGGIASPDGHCRAFDARAQGTVQGEGAGIVVLKRLADALEDKDHIYAVIKGFATNNDGADKVGFTAPSINGQAEVIALAQAVANVPPETIGYIVAHGTATPLGDPIEIAGLTKAFNTTAKNFCAIGSVKTNIGHLDAAAGIAGLINTALALHHKEIPPSLHFETPNPKIDFANSPFYVNNKLTPWPAGPVPRRAGVSSFGIGGTNAHVVLEEAPEVVPSATAVPPFLLTLSAQTESALNSATANLLTHLQTNPTSDLAAISCTLQTGRRAFRKRRVALCQNAPEVVQILKNLDANRLFTGEARDNTTVAFLFPGQGAQHVNMACGLYDTQPVFRAHVDECVEILKPILGCDLRQILYPNPDHAPQARAQLAQTAFTQPAIFVISYALAKLWMHWGIQPAAMIGHSVGEYTAACIAGVFSLPEALALVARRGRLVQDQPPGAMLAVRLSEKEIVPFLGNTVCLAAVNSPFVSILSGPKPALEPLQLKFRAAKVAAEFLETSHAFHSSMLDPVVEPFTQLVRQTKLRVPKIPFVSTLTGNWIQPEEATDPVYWGKHLRQTVRFSAALTQLLDAGTILLEAGPGQTLANLARQNPARPPAQIVLSSLPHAKAEQDDRIQTFAALAQIWIAGVNVNWPSLYPEKPQRVPLPTYPFERQNYFVEPNKTNKTREIPPSKLEPPAPTVQDEKPNTTESTLRALLSDMSGLKPAQLPGNTSFLELGFDSLFLTQFSRIVEQTFGARVTFGQMLEKYFTIELLAARLLELSALIPESKPESAARGLLKNTVSFALLPLTEGQMEIWFASQVSDEAQAAFNLSQIFEIEGPLNESALRQALQTLVNRHDALRTTFSEEGDAQSIAPGFKLDFPKDDWTKFSESERATRLDDFFRQERERPFDLIKGPLIRTRLIQLRPETHLLSLTVHHLICDGGSNLVLQNDLALFYNALALNQNPSCETAPSYTEYVRHQTEPNPRRASDEAYWLGQYSSPPAPLDLPADHSRATTTHRGAFPNALASCAFDQKILAQLNVFSAQSHCTLFTTLLAIYSVLLSKLSGQSDIAIGVPVALRASHHAEKLVGSCINFIPLRLETNTLALSVLTFSQYLDQVRKTFIDAFDHHQYSYGSIVQKLSLARDWTRPPLVSATFNLQHRHDPPAWPGLLVQQLPNPRPYTFFDLSLDVGESPDRLLIECSYRSDLFKPSTIQRWLEHYRTLATAVVAFPDRPLTEFHIDEPLRVGDNNKTNQTQPPALQTEKKPAAPSPIEERLAIIWREVIGLKQIELDDNFFDLGGHSVLVIQILTRVRNAFRVQLTLRNVFEAPTIRQLAKIIEQQLIAVATNSGGPPRQSRGQAELATKE